MDTPHARPSPTPVQQFVEIAAGLHELMRICDSAVSIEVLGVLSGGPQDVGTVTHALELEMSTVSKSLRPMRDDELVTCRILGSRREYALSKRVSVERSAEFVTMVIATPQGARLSISLPRGVIEELHRQLPAVVVNAPLVRTVGVSGRRPA